MIRPVPESVRRRSKGNALVEFAVGFPLLFLLMTGTFQFGYSFYVFNRLESAVRGAARFGAIYAYTSSNGAPTQAYLTAVKNFAVTGDPSGNSPVLVPGLTTGNVDVTVSTLNGVPDRVRVAVTGFQLNAVFATYTLSGRPFSSFRYAGRIAAL